MNWHGGIGMPKALVTALKALKSAAMGAVFVLAVYIVAYVARELLGLSSTDVYLVILAIGLVFVFLYLIKRVETLEHDESEHKNSVEDNDWIRKEIYDGERREPRHDRPSSLNPHGWKTFVSPPLEILYAEFDWFGAVLDQQVGGGWAIEETSNTIIRGPDAPQLGRTYMVYYHSIKMGDLEVGLGGYSPTAEAYVKNSHAIANLRLFNLRLVPYVQAHHLVSQLELLLGPFEKTSFAVDWAQVFPAYFDTCLGYEPDIAAARARARDAATSALTSYLWEAYRHADDYGPVFEYTTGGPYTLLRDTVEHWKKNGIDPYEKWYGGAKASGTAS